MAKVNDNFPFINNEVEDHIGRLEEFLPFVSLSGKSDTPWWNVPQVGNYHFGYCMGETMAHTLIKYYKSHHDAELAQIVTSMMIHFAKLDGLTFGTGREKEQSPEFESFFDKAVVRPGYHPLHIIEGAYQGKPLMESGRV